MNLEQQGVLKYQRTVVGEEDDAVNGGLDIAEYHAVVGVDDVGQSLAGHYALVGGDKATEDAYMAGLDMLKCGLIYHDALVGRAQGAGTDDGGALHHTQDGIDGLVATVEVYTICVSGIDGESLGIPQLPVVVEQCGVEGAWLVGSDVSHAEESGGLHVLVARLEHPHMGHEVARHVVTGQLDAVFVAAQAREDGGGNALGGLPLVVAGEHAVDVGGVHSPEASADVHGEWVARGYDENAVAVSDASPLLDEVQAVDQLRTDVLLLHLVAAHGSYDGERLLAVAKVIARDAEVVAAGRCHLKYCFFSHRNSSLFTIHFSPLKILAISEPS